MGLLDSVIKLRKFEEEQRQSDIGQISGAINNFIQLNQQKKVFDLKQKQFELQERKFEATQQPSELEQLLLRGKALRSAADIADLTGDPTALNALKKQSNVQEVLDRNLDPMISANTQVQTRFPEVDSFLSPGEELDQVPGFETTPSGQKLSPRGEVQKSLFETKAKAEIAKIKEVDTARLKEQVKTERDLITVDLKIDSNFDNFLDVAERTMELTGLPPGPIGGTMSQVLGAVKANEFVDGFKGGLIEVAAAVGRVAIPGARAVRLVDLFKETNISIHQNIESAIQTSADSMRNGMATDMGQNPEAYFPDADTMSKSELRVKMKDSLRAFEDLYVKTLLIRAYKRSPNLLTKRGRTRAEAFIKEDDNIIQSLGHNPDEWELIED